jgi:hypothetical protein
MVNMWKRSVSTEESAAAWINCKEGDKLRCEPIQHLRRGANEQQHAIGRGGTGELVAEDVGRLWEGRWQAAHSRHPKTWAAQQPARRAFLN